LQLEILHAFQLSWTGSLSNRQFLSSSRHHQLPMSVPLGWVDTLRRVELTDYLPHHAIGEYAQDKYLNPFNNYKHHS